MNTTAHFTTTKFADMSREEFKQKMLSLNRESLANLPINTPSTVNHRRTNDPTPTSFDWKDQKGVMTYVKDQGQCGSCWAFSIVENIESAWKLAGHDLVELSPQQVVSCDTVDQGCDGGDPQTAYQYIMQAGGLQTEKDYPYFSGDSGWSGKCEVKPDKFVAHVSNFSYGVPPCNDTCKDQAKYEQTVRDALYTIGPLSICVDASDWQDYDWGIFMGFCGSASDDLDHAVLLTGFNEKYGYYNVRNSWASDWGEDGYIRLSLGRNTCGMLDLVTYATVPHA
jgi:C1A family cysteine protease